MAALSAIKVKDEEVVVDMCSDANSPPSSAFVSALQSPYISPRAALATTSSPSEQQLPSTSYTPPSDPYEFTASSSDTPPPRISFSFPTFMLPPPPNNHSNNAKLRSCDVYIGFHGQSPPQGLLRFCRWLKAELELQGIACFLADRAAHEAADRVMCSAAFGLLVLTGPALSNRVTLEEINFFSRKKNLLPLFFSLDAPPPSLLLGELALHAAPDGSNWRGCVGAAASLLRARLGRKSSAVEADAEVDEVPFPRKEGFVGREEEMAEMEEALWEGRSRAAVVCVCGAAGMGKTELALEFAHRHRQRYKSVVWVGGEGRHLRQNMLEVSLSVGLDVTADPERERGRIRSFEEQESEALKRVKRHLFMLDMPYLLVVDNLDSCADPLDFLPNNTGPSHIILTTRLHSQSLPSSFRLIHLLPFPLSHSLTLFPTPTNDDHSLPLFHRNLNALPFGLCLVASLLSELSLSPSALLQAVDQQVLLEGDDDSDNPFLTKLLSFCFGAVGRVAARMAGVGAWLAPAPAPARLLCGGREPRRKRRWWCWWCPRPEEEAAAQLVRMGLARRANPPPHHDSDWIQVHPMAREYARRHHTRWGAKAAVRSMGTGMGMSQHLWASAFLVFGYKAEPPAVQLRPHDMVAYIRRTAVPLAKTAFVTFSRCNSAVELLKVCTNALEEVEKSFVSQIEDYWHVSSSLKNTLLVCLPCKTTNKGTVDEYVWQDVTLLKACLLEMRAKLLMRGGHFDTAEELCRTCISIRTVMLGHNHPLTLASQDTLSNLVRIRTKILL